MHQLFICNKPCKAKKCGNDREIFQTCTLFQLPLVGLVLLAHVTTAFSSLPYHALLRSSTSSLFTTQSQDDETNLRQELETFGFSNRLLTLAESDLPILAEVHNNGQWNLGSITSILYNKSITSSSVTTQQPIPRFKVSFNDGASLTTTIMDLGQITTVWKNITTILANNWQSQLQQKMDRFPIKYSNDAMEQIYSISHGTGWTKQQVSRKSEVIRKLSKTGKHMSRLINSEMALQYLITSNNETTLQQQQLEAGYILAKDAELGGRFKRFSCTLVSVDDETSAVTFVNGGWIAVIDQDVRTITEARKFAERSTILTVADERIAHHLECLAMGGNMAEVDASEALKAMNLPVTQQGAQNALIRLGRWSTEQNAKVEPWSRDVLDAATLYSTMDAKRRISLMELDNQIEGRVDLTKIPCVCIDAERVSFRDDAIGIRPRSMTGRKVVTEASKWEVMVHIADVSDIYTNDEDEHTQLLKGAAMKRGLSRYDLPLGPLHLMPHVALRALALDTIKVDSSSHSSIGGVNRCVTLWVYLDERTGKVIDAGVERTLISKPIALSFSEATSLLETNPQLEPRHPLMLARSVISVVDRILSGWTNYQTRHNLNSQKREERLAVRELVANEQYHQGSSGRRDEGIAGFQRSRGHRLVDTALDLHGIAMARLLRSFPIPMASGTSGGGRVGTAPLRRMVDGMVQKQALSVLCNYGGPPLTMDDCHIINQQMDKARNLLYSTTKGDQIVSLRALQAHLADRSSRVVILSAVSTGRENEVVLEGMGAIGTCKGVKGSLKPGVKVNVKVSKLQPEKGILIVTLV